MPAIQNPVWYPPTVMDREANAILAIRVRTRPVVGGGAPNQWLKPVPASAGTRVGGSQSIGGGSFQTSGGDTDNFA